MTVRPQRTRARTITRTYARVVLLLADLHIGSRYALWPERWEVEQGGTLTASPAQRKLLDFWRELMTGPVAEWDPDTVVLAADVLEGLNKKEFGASLMACDLEEQKGAAESLLWPVCKDRLTILVDGSLYHESLDTRVHKDLAVRLKAEGADAIYCGAMANIRLKGTNRTINVAHGVGGGAIYRGTQIDREALFAELGAATRRIPRPDIIARGHLHYYERVETETGLHVIQIPCWKSYQAMKLTVGCYGRKQPAIGAVIVAIREADDGIEIHPYLMPAPPKIDDNLRSL